MTRHLVLYTDGSVRHGSRAGIGYVVATPDGFPLRRRGEPLPFPASVNEAEYYALISALREALRLGADSVECYLDSELVRQQVLGNWECNHEHLRRLRDEARALLERFQSWTLERVESERNVLAHTYATCASDQNRRHFWKHPRKRLTYERTHHTGGTDTMRLVVTQNEVLPEDVYNVTLTAVEAVTGSFGEQLRWRFTVTDGEHKNATLTAWSNLSTATNSKTMQWASVLAGERFQAGDVVDFDRLIGRRARAVVICKDTNDGRRFNRITELLPLRVHKAETDYDPFLEEEDVA